MPNTPPRGTDGGTPPLRTLPERPSLEQLRKQAKGLLSDAQRGDANALARIKAATQQAAADGVLLAHAQLTIAREYGFAHWPKLVEHVQGIVGGGAFVLRPLIRPVELTSGLSWELADGTRAPTDDVFSMFVAAREGDFRTIRRLTEQAPALATVLYNYTPPIHFAAREGHRDIVEYLLNHGADVAYTSYPFKESLLMFAEDRGHADVALLLRQRLARRFSIASSTRVIIEAAERGDLTAVEAELQREPTLAHAANETGDTALHHAAKRGHLHIVRALIAAGANVDATRGDGYRPIHDALMPNWFFPVESVARNAIADLLLAHGARNTVFIAALRGDDQYVRTAVARDRTLANFEDTCHHRVLSAAVRCENLQLTRFLLAHGADPNLPEEGSARGLSLWIAVNDRRHDIVRELLAHGADPNAVVESSGTPMSHAESKDVELAALLAQHGGRRHEPTAHDKVAQLARAGQLTEAEELLRKDSSWIHDDVRWGDGILAGPANEGRHDIIALLLKYGARIPTVSKWAPEYYFKHAATAAFLLENGMNANHMNWHRFTLLHHMAAKGEIEKARLLLDHGADINAIDDEYRSTPLGVAARSGQRTMVEFLLSRGADVAAAGAPWAVPVSWAERKGYGDLLEMLQR